MEKVSCFGLDGKQCEYRGTWFCKHPKCKSLILTSTLIGTRPSGCPKINKWNRKEV